MIILWWYLTSVIMHKIIKVISLELGVYNSLQSVNHINLVRVSMTMVTFTSVISYNTNL